MITAQRDGGKDLVSSIRSQPQLGADRSLAAQQATHVEIAAVGPELDHVGGANAVLFRIEHGEQGPLDDVEPAVIALVYHRTQGLLGDHRGFTVLAAPRGVPEDVREVAITEGEIDAMSLHQLGHPALSVPFGGGKGDKQRWIEYEYPHLERFDTIFLCLDADQPGREAAEDIAERPGRHPCRMVDLPSGISSKKLIFTQKHEGTMKVRPASAA